MAETYQLDPMHSIVISVYKNFKRTFGHPAARTPQSGCCDMVVCPRASATSPQ